MIVSAPIWVAMATAQGEVLRAYTDNSGAADGEEVPFIEISNLVGATELSLISILGAILWLINYFGNACMWWGIWLAACQAPWGWATIFAPIIMTLLLTKVSGRDLLERDMGRRKSYQDYIAKTSGFFPMPPRSN